MLCLSEHGRAPKDILATACHLLDIDQQQVISDRQGHYGPLVYGGQVVRELIG